MKTHRLALVMTAVTLLSAPAVAAAAPRCPCDFLAEPPAQTTDEKTGWGAGADCQSDAAEALMFATGESGAFVTATGDRCEVGRLNFPFLREADGISDAERAACIAESITLADRLEAAGVEVERVPTCTE